MPTGRDRAHKAPRRDHPYDPQVLRDLARIFLETTLREDGSVICPDEPQALAYAEEVLDILYYSGYYNVADVAGLRFHLYPRLEADGQPDLIYANTWEDGRWMEIGVVEVPRPQARPPEAVLGSGGMEPGNGSTPHPGTAPDALPRNGTVHGGPARDAAGHGRAVNGPAARDGGP